MPTRCHGHVVCMCVIGLVGSNSIRVEVDILMEDDC